MIFDLTLDAADHNLPTHPLSHHLTHPLTCLLTAGGRRSLSHTNCPRPHLCAFRHPPLSTRQRGGVCRLQEQSHRHQKSGINKQPLLAVAPFL